MKETVSDALDWRHHFRNNPIAFSIGALSVGALLGYGLAGALKGNGSDEGYPSSEESDIFARTNATPQRYEDEEARHSAFHGGSFAAQPITDGTSATSEYEQSSSSTEAGGEESDYGRSQTGSVSYLAPRAEQREQTPEKPGLFERFKETSAYDRLQTEVSTLGDRFIEELSSTAHNVVLPALFNKLKEMFGVDLSGKQQESSSSGSSQQTQATSAPQTNSGARAASASASSTSASLASASRGGSSDSSYGTSENRGYGAQSDADRGGEGSSVLDLDR